MERRKPAKHKIQGKFCLKKGQRRRTEKKKKEKQKRGTVGNLKKGK